MTAWLAYNEPLYIFKGSKRLIYFTIPKRANQTTKQLSSTFQHPQTVINRRIKADPRINHLYPSDGLDAGFRSYLDTNRTGEWGSLGDKKPRQVEAIPNQGKAEGDMKPSKPTQGMG